MRNLLPYLMAIVLVCSGFLFAQNQEKRSTTDTDVNQLQKTNEEIIPQPQYLEQALEKEIDSTQYVLGPGDVLLIKVWGILENQFMAEVTPEGFVIIPTIREIRVAGETLAAGIAKIKQSMEQYFTDAAFSVRLIKLRKFRVFVVGEIRQSGTYYLRYSDRLGDAIQLAGGLTTWGDDTRIQLRHLNGAVDTVNISKFYVDGDLEQNPNLDAGDVIYIPPIDLERDYVTIEGNVGSEGIYQLRKRETLFDFLSRVRALNRRSDIRNVLLVRGEEAKTFNLLDEQFSIGQVVLQKGDKIIVPTNRNQVYVKGEVAQPGALPYLANYTAEDYAGIAGVLETAKKMNEIYVIHTATGEVEKGNRVVVQKGDIVVVPRRGRELFKEYLAIITPVISMGLSVYAIIRTVR